MSEELKPSEKYRWTAYFRDGVQLEQLNDEVTIDRAVKHDAKGGDYELIYFDVNDGSYAYGVDLPTGRFGINGTWFSLEGPGENIYKRKPYFRATETEVQVGYTGELETGESVLKVITLR